MGFLKVNGRLMTYNEYREKIKEYKLHSLLQFLSIYKSQKGLTKNREDLKFGEEIEYSLFYFRDESVKLSGSAYELIS